LASSLTGRNPERLFVVILVFVVFILVAAEADFEARIIIIPNADFKVQAAYGDPTGVSGAGGDEQGSGKKRGG
jgi:hypothetical protein